MEGVWVVVQQNADITDTLHLRDVAMATTFWLLMGYSFGCVIASSMIFVLAAWYLILGMGFRVQSEYPAEHRAAAAVRLPESP